MLFIAKKAVYIKSLKSQLNSEFGLKIIEAIACGENENQKLLKPAIFLCQIAGGNKMLPPPWA